MLFCMVGNLGLVAGLVALVCWRVRVPAHRSVVLLLCGIT